jgi:hypothetical protein
MNPQGSTSQKTTFFLITAGKTSNATTDKISNISTGKIHQAFAQRYVNYVTVCFIMKEASRPKLGATLRLVTEAYEKSRPPQAYHLQSNTAVLSNVLMYSGTIH